VVRYSSYRRTCVGLKAANVGKERMDGRLAAQFSQGGAYRSRDRLIMW
jgi:hypothetical protein